MNKLKKVSPLITFSLFTGLVIGYIAKSVGNWLNTPSLTAIVGALFVICAFVSLNRKSNVSFNLGVPDAFWTASQDNKRIPGYKVNFIQFVFFLLSGAVIVLIAVT